MNTIKIFFSVMVIGQVFISCKQNQPAAVQENKPFCLSDTMQHMISIDSAGICRIVDQLQLSGEVSFDENKVIKIFPPSSGQVVECKVSAGDKVHAGQVLAIIRSADIAGNYADKSQAGADVEIAKRQMDNEASLFKNGIASEKDYEEAKGDYDKTLAAKRKIESLININGGSNSSVAGTYSVVSPIDGYIVEKNINEGNFIREDMSDNIFTISDLKDVWVLANVFEKDIPRIKDGLHVAINTLAYPDKIYDGIIGNSSEVLDPVNKVMKVRVRLQNPGMELKPGMFAKVIVTNELQDSAVCIPSAGIVEDDGKDFVIVYNNNCDLKVQPIDVLKVNGDSTYLSSGLQPGQKLITKNAMLLYYAFTEK